MENDINLQLDLPPEASHYSFRIGGHTHIQGELKLGTLKHKDGSILKPLITNDFRSERELLFYQQVFENSESDPVLCDLKKFLPVFHGTWETTINGTKIKYLCIEDVCRTFENPSILDVKIGPITYEPTASEEKKNKDRRKYPVVGIIGFRILGMKVYDHSQQVYVSHNRKFGLSLMPDTVNAGIGKFFNNEFGQINCLILSGMIHKLLQLRSWFSKQRRLVLYSSSLLLTYEGNMASWMPWFDRNSMHVVNLRTCKDSSDSSSKYALLHHSDCSPVFSIQASNKDFEEKCCSDCNLHQDICIELQKDCDLLRIAIIDFAHVLPSSQEDTNYLFGLDNFILNLKLLLNSYLEKFL